MPDKSFVGGEQYPNSPPAYNFGQPSTNPALAQQTADPGYWDWYASAYGTRPSPVYQPNGSVNPNKDPTQLQPGYTGVGSGGLPLPSRPMSPDVRPTGVPSVPGRPAQMMPPLPIPRPSVAPIYTTLPNTSRPHWSQHWLANQTRNAMAQNNLNKMPPLNGGNRAPASYRPQPMPSLPPPPQTFQGSSTGQPYNVGQTYAGTNGYLYIARPDGTFQQSGQAPGFQGMSPSAQYNAASNYDPVPNGQEWMSNSTYPDGTPRS